jgi:hypothetical protein
MKIPEVLERSFKYWIEGDHALMQGAEQEDVEKAREKAIEAVQQYKKARDGRIKLTQEQKELKVICELLKNFEE